MRVLVLLVLVLAAGCGGGDDDGPAEPQGDVAIDCHTAYRPAVTQGIEEERDARLGVNQPVVHDHGRLVWHAEHQRHEGEGETLVVRVESGDGGLVTSSLFQLDGAPANDFRGGHGFTGLQYAYDAGGAELQWWCTA